MAALDRLNKLKMLILDVDGVLTDGHTWQDSSGAWRRVFSVRDTMGMRALLKGGFKIAVVTSAEGREIQDHVGSIGIEELHVNCENKSAVIENLMRQHGFVADEVALMSESSEDVSLMKTLGVSFTVPSAPAELREAAGLVTSKQGGDGAVLEVCNWIMQNANILRASRNGRRAAG